MADSKLSLEDILDEYKANPDDKSTSGVNREDTRKILNSTIPDPVREVMEVPKAVSHMKNELFDGDTPNVKPSNEIKPAELSTKKAAVAGDEGITGVKSTHPIDNKETAELLEGSSKIRPMYGSTRAREAVKKKKKKWFGKDESQQTYSKEKAAGEYMYIPPDVKKKKRTREEIINEAESPENRKNLTDIVPSPAALEATRPIELAPRAETTNIDLSSIRAASEESIDVRIASNAEEYTRQAMKAKRTKRIVDFNYYGDVQDVGRDIYELLGILKTRVAVLGLTAFLSVYITICSRFNFPIAEFLSIYHIHTYLLAHLLLGALSLFYSYPVITKGFKNLVKFKADSDSMTAVTAAACFISLLGAFLQTDMARAELIHIYMPVGILALLTNAIGKYLILKRARRNFKFASRDFNRHGVVYVKDEERAERLIHGTSGDFPILAAMRPTDFLTDFLRYTYSSDITDSFCRRAVPLCLGGSLIVSVILTVIRMGTLLSVEAFVFGLSILTMLLCACSCIALPFAANIPLEKVSKETLKNDGILLGYQSVDDLYDTNSLLVKAEDIFTEGTVRLGGIKVFSNTKLDEAFLDAASLSYHGGSLLQQLFADLIKGRENLLYPIDNFSYEDGMGLCGWIKNRRILLGSRELMETHNIEGLPTKTREAEYAKGHEPIYLSISGSLAAMFVVDVIAGRGVRKWIERLVRKKVCIVVKSVDSFITDDKISAVYGIPKGMVKVLPKKLHEDFDAETKKAVRLSASMACAGKFSSMAQLILGIKNIHSSAVIALIFQTVSILLGFGLSMMLILSKAYESNYIYMSATAMIIYNFICTLLTCFAAGSKKR
ncbi:MAG: hypothetical protein IJN43_12750 [Ruminococcus sp.]|nr:hypothetical protein [Ruminococcus sp.]